MSDLNSDVEPFAGLRPSDVELVIGRLNNVVRVVVDRVGGVMKLGIGGIDTLVHAELIQVGSVGWIEAAASQVFRICVVVCDAFAAAVIVGALDPPRNALGPFLIVAVLIRSSLVAL